jgi:transposase InsO family protein
MQQIYIESYFKGYKKLIGYIDKIEGLNNEEIHQRLKVMAFFDTYGAQATKEAFGVARSTVFLWKKKLKQGQGNLSALASASKAPHKKRTREVSQSVVQFIKEYRNMHPGVGKEIIKPALDDFCVKNKLKTVSSSTIGRVLNELKVKGCIIDFKPKQSYYARSGRFIQREKTRIKKQRRPKGYKPKHPGDLVQLDSVHRFVNGVKRYLITAIDVKTRFGFSYAYPHLSSDSARDFMEKFSQVCPFAIRKIQTDNGLEFAKHFQAYIQKQNMTHYYSYPRHPQSNAYVERFNRTLSEYFIKWHEEDLTDIKSFNNKLMDFCLWYNIEKPHKGLNKLPPLKYYVNEFVKQPSQSNMSWTPTSP